MSSVYGLPHYSTPEDVLAEAEDELLAEIASIIDEDSEGGETALVLCRAIADSRKRWHALWRGNPNFIERAMALYRERMLARWDMRETRDSETDEISLRFITVGHPLSWRNGSKKAAWCRPNSLATSSIASSSAG